MNRRYSGYVIETVVFATVCPPHYSATDTVPLRTVRRCPPLTTTDSRMLKQERARGRGMLRQCLGKSNRTYVCIPGSEPDTQTRAVT